MSRATENDRAEVEAILIELLPAPSERMLLLKLLVADTEAAAGVAPDAWAVTLFTNGFRLNVGQVEALAFINKVLRVNLSGTAGLPPFIGRVFQNEEYRSVPQPQCAFLGSVAKFVPLDTSLRPAHFEFIRLAALAPSGRPRKGTPFRGSHSEALMAYAQRAVLEAAAAQIEKSNTNNERLRVLMQQHGLTRRQVSELLHKAVTRDGQTPAVNKWLASREDGGNYRPMSDADLELLELKINARPKQRQRG